MPHLATDLHRSVYDALQLGRVGPNERNQGRTSTLHQYRIKLFIALLIGSSAGCASFPRSAHTIPDGFASTGAATFVGTFRVDHWRQASIPPNPPGYIEMGGGMGPIVALLYGPNTDRTYRLPSGQEHRVVIRLADANTLEFILLSDGTQVTRRSVAVDRIENGYLYLDEWALGFMGIPFVVGHISHAQVRLSMTSLHALVVQHAVSSSGALLLFGHTHLDSEYSLSGVYEPVVKSAPTYDSNWIKPGPFSAQFYDLSSDFGAQGLNIKIRGHRADLIEPGQSFATFQFKVNRWVSVADLKIALLTSSGQDEVSLRALPSRFLEKVAERMGAGTRWRITLTLAVPGMEKFVLSSETMTWDQQQQ
jgi:hypothetical protein